VVDDDEQVLRSLCALVISLIGYDCLRAGNRFEAVEILKKSRWVIVLSDLFLEPRLSALLFASIQHILMKCQIRFYRIVCIKTSQTEIIHGQSGGFNHTFKT